jgi:hypothetical protein
VAAVASEVLATALGLDAPQTREAA